MSFLPCFCDLPQKEHFSSSTPSPNVATSSFPRLGSAGPSDRAGVVGQRAGRDALVDDAVLARLFRGHHENALGVLVDLLGLLARVVGAQLVELDPPPLDLSGRALVVGGLAAGLAPRLVHTYPGLRPAAALPLLSAHRPPTPK